MNSAFVDVVNCWNIPANWFEEPILGVALFLHLCRLHLYQFDELQGQISIDIMSKLDYSWK